MFTCKHVTKEGRRIWYLGTDIYGLSKSLVDKLVQLSVDAYPSFSPEHVSSCFVQDLLGIGEYRPGASRAP